MYLRYLQGLERGFKSHKNTNTVSIYRFTNCGCCLTWWKACHVILGRGTEQVSESKFNFGYN